MAKYSFGEIAINQMNNRRKLEEEQKQFNEKMAEETRQANLLTAFRNQQIANEQQQLKLYAERDAETRRQNEWERAQDPVVQQNEGLIDNKWMNYSVTKSGKVIPTSGAPNPYAGLYARSSGGGGSEKDLQDAYAYRANVKAGIKEISNFKGSAYNKNNWADVLDVNAPNGMKKQMKIIGGDGKDIVFNTIDEAEAYKERLKKQYVDDMNKSIDKQGLRVPFNKLKMELANAKRQIGTRQLSNEQMQAIKDKLINDLISNNPDTDIQDIETLKTSLDFIGL